MTPTCPGLPWLTRWPDSAACVFPQPSCIQYVSIYFDALCARDLNTLIGKLAAKIFGTANEREMKRIRPLVEQISALEPQMQQLSDEQLRAKTDEFRSRVRERLEGIEEETERVTA